jgi:hypothetical protein
MVLGTHRFAGRLLDWAQQLLRPRCTSCANPQASKDSR